MNWNILPKQITQNKGQFEVVGKLISSNKETRWTTDMAGLCLPKFNNFRF